ncbi:MAG: hypothetical protein ACTH5K_05875, partial [Pseudolactococcus laudensis]
ETAEFVVPKSIPIILDIMNYLNFLFYFLFVLILFSEVGGNSMKSPLSENKIWEVYALRILFVRTRVR